MKVKVLLFGGPQDAATSLSSQEREALTAVVREVFARSWTLGVPDDIVMLGMIDEVRKNDNRGEVEIYALEESRTPGRTEATGMVYRNSQDELLNAMMSGAEGAIFVGGTRFGDAPATETMSPLLNIFGAITEIHRMQNVVLTGFGGNTSETKFRELATARDPNTVFINNSDPTQAAYYACEDIEHPNA